MRFLFLLFWLGGGGEGREGKGGEVMWCMLDVLTQKLLEIHLFIFLLFVCQISFVFSMLSFSIFLILLKCIVLSMALAIILILFML